MDKSSAEDRACGSLWATILLSAFLLVETLCLPASPRDGWSFVGSGLRALTGRQWNGFTQLPYYVVYAHHNPRGTVVVTHGDELFDLQPEVTPGVPSTGWVATAVLNTRGTPGGFWWPWFTRERTEFRSEFDPAIPDTSKLRVQLIDELLQQRPNLVGLRPQLIAGQTTFDDFDVDPVYLFRNIVDAAAAVGVVICMRNWRRARRDILRERGLCVHCRYQVNDLPRCPECGKEV
jgi:hypothetical protein